MLLNEKTQAIHDTGESAWKDQGGLANKGSLANAILELPLPCGNAEARDPLVDGLAWVEGHLRPIRARR